MKAKTKKGTAPKQTGASHSKGNKEQGSTGAKRNTGRQRPENMDSEGEDKGEKNLEQPMPGKNKGEERNKQRKSLKSDVRNSPDHPDKQEATNIRKKIHSSPGSDTEPMK